MEYVALYALLVTWLAALLLYQDGYLVHSKKEIALAPLLLAVAFTRSIVLWRVKKYEYRRY